MERRVVIKQVMIMAAGMALLPSCLRDKGQSSIALQNLDISAQQEQLLAEITETLIPLTDSPGAKALNLHLFVLKMVDDCYSKAMHALFISGLDQLGQISQKQFDRHFAELSVAERESILTAIEVQPQADTAISTFYKIMKEETIKGYLNSKYVMTNLIVWELVPGRYNGYYPVQTA